jgi:2-hydroxychromene-2-carboxylate isomerase
MTRAAAAPAALDFYFDFISGYGYFASLRIEAIAARHGRAVNWHSMLLGVSVMKVMGLKPLLDTPLKGDYVLRDAARYMRRHGLTLVRRISDPMMDPRPAARAFYWVKRHHPGFEAAFARAVYDRYWRLGKDLSDPAEIAAAAASLPDLGLDPSQHRTRRLRIALHRGRWRAVLGFGPARTRRRLADPGRLVSRVRHAIPYRSNT